MVLTRAQRRVNEATTDLYEAVIEDENGDAIAAASLTTLTLTLWDKLTGTVINSRNAQNVLNTNGVTVDASGNLVWTMTPADNALTGTTLTNGQIEEHLAEFIWTWAAGVKKGNHQVQIDVLALDKVS